MSEPTIYGVLKELKTRHDTAHRLWITISHEDAQHYREGARADALEEAIALVDELRDVCEDELGGISYSLSDDGLCRVSANDPRRVRMSAIRNILGAAPAEGESHE